MDGLKRAIVAMNKLRQYRDYPKMVIFWDGSGHIEAKHKKGPMAGQYGHVLKWSDVNDMRVVLDDFISGNWSE